MAVTNNTYYLGYDLVDAIVQVDGGASITEYRLDYPNKINPSTEKDTLTWKGGGKTKKIETLASVNLTLDLDCFPLAAHQDIFSKAAITAAAGGGMTLTSIVPLGGGNDVGGVSIGLILDGNAIKVDTAGVETVVKLRFWYPVGTLTLSAPPAYGAGATADKWQYAFSASKTLVDINGGAITGAPVGGEYVYIGEVPAV